MQQNRMMMPPREETPRKPLDSFDRAILRLVQQDNRMPQRRIAEQVNLSAAAVQRRIAAMEQAGIIARNVAVVDPEALGMGITAIVEVNLHDERSASVDAAKALFRATPEVQQCYFATAASASCSSSSRPICAPTKCSRAACSAIMTG